MSPKPRTYRFFIVDVFTQVRFGGNPLAVIPEADGISDDDMQRIAREFNFSETTFVLATPPGVSADRRLRIFTPTQEVGFAGHPNVGSAFALARDNAFGEFDTQCRIVFDEAAGPVPILIERNEDGELWCELQAPQPLSVGSPLDASLAADVLGLDVDDIDVSAHMPCEASVGLAFMIVALSSREALARAAIDHAVLSTLHATGVCADIFCYWRDDTQLHARMFAPLDGVPEDPATGSANAALVALLTSLASAPDGEFAWQIQQGVDMGRPSTITARTSKRAGELEGVWIGGFSVLSAEGTLHL